MRSPIARVGIYTLGCKVNQYESQAIAELFEARGFEICQPSQVCDVYVINTCTVTAESDRKARQFIRRAIHQNPSAYVLVTGCYSQTQPQTIAKIEGVDYICGNARKQSVVDAAEELLQSGKKTSPRICCAPPDCCGFEPMQITKFDRTRAYVKIEDGCENHCAYCIIPHARGKVRSKDPRQVVEEVTLLTQNHCREIVLTGIETASYGKDLEGYGLADLLCEIDTIPNIGRIRLGSLDPSLIKQSFADRIAPLHSLAPHFHLSMQSGCDRILALMRRKYNTKMALAAMERLRAAIPYVQFTTDMIVGFPGESEEDFEQTLSFVRQAEFLMIHVFPYSRRAGTEADKMPNQIAPDVKHQRVTLLSQEAEKTRKKILDRYQDFVTDVLFETYENGVAFGHTSNFIEVACKSPVALHGQQLPVQITGNDGSICHGTLILNEKKG